MPFTCSKLRRKSEEGYSTIQKQVLARAMAAKPTDDLIVYAARDTWNFFMKRGGSHYEFIDYNI